jgi:hypothetical protein
MFGFIKKLIGGIFGFLGGIFSKKEDYYLELKEETGQETAKTESLEFKVTPTEPEPIQATKEPTFNPDQATISKTPTPKKEPVKAEATETTFAPKYLIPKSSNGRRRPGANMSSFLDMAGKVKVPG